MVSGILIALALSRPPALPAEGGMCVLSDSCQRETPEQPPERQSPPSPAEPVARDDDLRLAWQRADGYENGAPQVEHRPPLLRPPRA